jgi:inhibitor of KinA sporulation pathway (predicted exonuclease)
MLPEELKLLERLQQQFKDARTEAYQYATGLWEAKGEEYDIETGIWSRVPFDELSLCHEVYKGSVRLAEMMKAIDEAGLRYEGIDEKIADLVNYALAWAAYRTMRRKQRKAK